MKYGVVCTCATSNIGDDIQSLAAIDLLRKNGISEYICVEREALKHYSGEPIALIMNGWFLHNPNNFPPSDKIKPLFISFHCEHEEVIKEHRKYFQKHDFFPISLFHLDGKILISYQLVQIFFSDILKE